MATTFTSDKVLSEKGVGIVQVVFKDEDDVAVTPNVSTIKWTLTNRPVHGESPTVINSRTQVAIASLSTINIVLKGDDLAMLSGEVDDAFVERVLLVEYQYDSSVQNNLDDKAQHIFRIENLHYPT